jgi:hypothetical protein
LARDSASDAPRISAPGHDADHCTLCALLAQMRVGQAPLAADGVLVSAAYLPAEHRPVFFPADVVLSFAARGPPSC